MGFVCCVIKSTT